MSPVARFIASNPSPARFPNRILVECNTPMLYFRISNGRLGSTKRPSVDALNSARVRTSGAELLPHSATILCRPPRETRGMSAQPIKRV
jgi:hypothetical protein